jgi:hypothetical protein
MTRSITVDVDISQTLILQKFVAYLKINKRDAMLIEEMDSGHCMGFTVLALYALLLELTVPLKKNPDVRRKQRDDWIWMKNALSRLSRWDEKPESLNKKTISAKKLRRDTERLISLIVFFQNSASYIASTQMRTHCHLYEGSDRPFYQEYSFAGLFTPEEFTQTIEISGNSPDNPVKTSLLKEIIKENRMVFISCLNHVTGVIKHENQYYFYNSNAKFGWAIYQEDEFDKLAEAFCSAHYENIQKKLPYNISVLSRISEKREAYVSQDKLLAALNQTPCVIGEDTYASTALYVAADVGCRKSVRYYLANPPIPLNEYVNKACSDNETPLHVAAREGFTDIVIDLLNAGANIDALNDSHESSLLRSTRSGYENTVKILLQRGADPDVADKHAFTPLYVAVSKENQALVQLLLSGNANVNKKSYLGNSPLHKAVQNGNQKIVELLLARGADVNARNSQYKTPFHEAITGRQYNVIETLLDSPLIQITAEDYDMLKKAAEANPKNVQLKHCLAKAQPAYMAHIIKQQLEALKRNNARIYLKGVKKLEESTQAMINPDLNSRDKSLLLLQQMLPVLGDAGKTSLSIWKKSRLVDPILRFASSIDITPQDIMNYHHGSSPTVKIKI